MSSASRARKVEQATELSYQTCLQLVRGELSFVPKEDDCKVLAALKGATKGRYKAPRKGHPCPCSVCNIEARDEATRNDGSNQ
jgi:hypothetical protein